MIQEICKDERFLAQKAEPATPADLPIAHDLIDTLTAHKEIYNLVSDMMGMQQIVPFAKETFSIGMELPGTKENQEMWEYARKHGPEAFRKYFAQRIAAVAEEDKKPL